MFDDLGFNVVNLPIGGMQIGDIIFDYYDPYPTSGSLITINPDGYVSPLTPLIVSGDFRVYSLTNNVDATIVIKRDNIILDGCGHRLKGGVAVVQTKASCKENVTVKSMRIEGGLDGLELYHATGIWTLILESYERHGIFLSDVFNVAILNNTIVGCQVGVVLMGAKSCIISGNSIMGATGADSENNFVKNNVSIFIETDYLTDVIAHVFHNNFVENGRAYGNPPRCVWDNGYPAGGNYWSDYVGVDEKSGTNQDQPGKDGIGDKPYLASGRAVDRYPLMEPTSELPLMTFSYIVEGQIVLLTSNSGISNFKYNLENQTLSFQVQGKSGTKGFVNLDIPKNIADGQVEVLFDGKPIPFNKSENVDRVNINFTYEHSKHYIEIRFRTGEGPVSLPTPSGPEFQWGLTWTLAIVIVVFMTAATLLYYTKRKK
ncbi:MAG: NosD domain-containing protein [Candidatus Bathyarchaeota archaeon]